MATATLQTKAALLRAQLESFYADLISSGGDALDPGVYTILAPPLCRLAKMIIPDVHQKVDEIVYAADHGLHVNPHQHGADLVDANNNHHELKVSICKKPIKRCNFNWPVPKGATEKERRDKLLTSINEKVKGDEGGAILIVRNGVGVELAKYELAGTFLLGYFARIPLGKCGNHNMGCDYCPKCETFHRLDKLQEASNATSTSVPTSSARSPSSSSTILRIPSTKTLGAGSTSSAHH